MVTNDFLESKEYATKRENLQKEINRNCYNTKDTSSERWKKTPEERLSFATMMLNHRDSIRKAGFNPNKRMNISAPVTGKVW